MAFIKVESEDMKIEEVFSVKQEEMKIEETFRVKPEEIKMEETFRVKPEEMKIEETFRVKQEETEEQTGQCHERAPQITDRPKSDNEDERMRKKYLEAVFASLDADIEDRCFTEALLVNTVADSEEQDECSMMIGGYIEKEEEEDDDDRKEDECDGMDESDEDDDDEVSTSIPCQELTTQKTPRIGKPCGPQCRKKCKRKITEGQRMEIFGAYGKLTYPEKKHFIFRMISQQQTQRYTTGGPTQRKRTYQYHLNDHLGQRQKVCKTMFLSTLGYHPKNDSLIVTVFGSATSSTLAPPQDRRGRHTPSNKVDRTPMFEHIESFHPSISHYRRERAPNSRYLPSDINIRSMFNDYRQRFQKCSYETYRKAVKELNISFTKLGEEECG